MDGYFCKPHALAERYGGEHQWRFQRFLSRDADIAALSDEVLIDICEPLNETPRKCLGLWIRVCRSCATLTNVAPGAHG
jgi:IS30 family transposase